MGTGGPESPPPLKNHKNIGFLSNIGQDPLKNHKAGKLALKLGPQLHASEILIAFRWWADKGPLIAALGSSLPLINLKNVKVGKE